MWNCTEQSRQEEETQDISLILARSELNTEQLLSQLWLPPFPSPPNGRYIAQVAR